MILAIINSLKADSIKMKHTIFYWIHICIPILGVLLVVIDYFIHNSDGISSIGTLLETISLIFPILISVICSLVIEQEENAGNFKEILGNIYGKYLGFFSKILILLFFGLASTILTISGYFIVSKFFLQQDVFDLSFYIELIFITFGSQIFLYLFHTFLSFTLGSAGSIGISIFESLITALMETSLGDGVWFLIPCGWCIRFTKYFIAHQSLTSFFYYVLSIKCSILFTIIFFIFLIIWFHFYEGKKII
ncbi:ABC-2 family transporter protein [Clostridium saccharobutylicum]|nr:lantibiotic immunity ABC transporter MutG family permease subunit [Clostridium saccharobutylicum]AQS11419.1 ABC-2 family transporter protein [Clostridium saccharobutylicum]MBC2435176.1 lantibiotic immunity ABC transporter MutG family permease subunit [Clostridium saccharobutylicum]NSB88657.1 ABC-2 type transport system permease protein [Clostridium saccharobutylicum]NYC30602.1 ABC-2 type transport system permease protein [Clostridium saccharobutylicum]OOM12221.1 ABC-2 family transporter pro